MTAEQRLNKNLKQRERYLTNSATKLEKNAAWKAANPEKVKSANAVWRLANQEHLNCLSRAWRKANPEKAKEITFRHYHKHREKRILAKTICQLQRRRNDPYFRAQHNIQTRIQLAIKRASKDARKAGRTIELLGCSYNDLKRHIENKFLPGMSWDNHGLLGWHFDHIKPCASFDLTDQEQQKACFHFTNLQPLWAKDNIAKGAK